jgi:membrane-bound metal-dependent hydrolase YbcI (DUF457 family)
MSALTSRATRVDPVDAAIAAAVVGLTLATAYIHSTLGGLLFTLNAIGYAMLAVAQVAPLGPLAKYRWVARLALIGFAASTIGGWVVMGARYMTAYVANGIEVAIIVLVVVQVFRVDGGPRGIAGKAIEAVGDVMRVAGIRRAPATVATAVPAAARV